MFKLNLKIALRNLWKNKAYTFISVSGLAMSLAIFILAMLYANYERSYDHWNNGYQDIYRVNYKSGSEDVAFSPGNMATVSKDRIAAVQASTRIQDYWAGDMLVKGNSKSLYVNDILFADSNFLKVFQYPMLYGNPQKALLQPRSLILSKQTSEEIFGKGVNPVGEVLKMNDHADCTVDGVIDEAAFPSHFRFKIVYRFKTSASTDYYTNNYYTYLKLNPGTDLAHTTKLLNNNRKEILNAELAKLPAEEKNGFGEFISSNILYLQPLADIHLSSTGVEYELAGNGIGKYVYLMLIVATLVLTIAAVNFMNLSITMATNRARETGIRKVMGAYRIQIAIQFIMETAMHCIISLIAALILVELFLPSFNQLIGQTIQLNGFTGFYEFSGQILSVLLLLILLVGLYPAVVISNVVPARVLKGNYANSNSGYLIRNGLIVLQFSIAVLFISGIWVVNSQLNYMQKKDLGYKADQVIAINLMQDYSDQHYREVAHRLREIPGITSISRTDHIPGEDMGGNSYGNNGVSYSSNFMSVDAGYLSLMGMTLLEGRDFSADIPSDTLNALILTETAAKTFHLTNPVGKMLRFQNMDVKVIGLIKDFNHYSPEKAIQPIVFQYMKGNPLRYVLVKIDPAQSTVILREIEKAWQKLEPAFPVRYTLLDKNFEGLLKKQAQLRQLIGILSGVTVVLALMGIFAISAFATQRRSKEISIRKVLGASIVDILTLLNKGFARLVILANLIALPFAWFILQNWLSDFAFRIDMPVLPFVLAMVITLLLTVLIVSLQSFKEATANPAEVLKSE